MSSWSLYYEPETADALGLHDIRANMRELADNASCFAQRTEGDYVVLSGAVPASRMLRTMFLFLPSGTYDYLREALGVKTDQEAMEAILDGNSIQATVWLEKDTCRLDRYTLDLREPIAVIFEAQHRLNGVQENALTGTMSVEMLGRDTFDTIKLPDIPYLPGELGTAMENYLQAARSWLCEAESMEFEQSETREVNVPDMDIANHVVTDSEYSIVFAEPMKVHAVAVVSTSESERTIELYEMLENGQVTTYVREKMDAEGGQMSDWGTISSPEEESAFWQYDIREDFSLIVDNAAYFNALSKTTSQGVESVELRGEIPAPLMDRMLDALLQDEIPIDYLRAVPGAQTEKEAIRTLLADCLVPVYAMIEIGTNRLDQFSIRKGDVVDRLYTAALEQIMEDAGETGLNFDVEADDSRQFVRILGLDTIEDIAMPGIE